MKPQIVHEAEIHRQHVRLRIPIAVEIDGTRFGVDDWSMGGFGVAGPITSRQPGERFPARLIFPFEDFELTLRLDCQMVYVLPDLPRFGCPLPRPLAGPALAVPLSWSTPTSRARSSAAATCWRWRDGTTRLTAARTARPSIPYAEESVGRRSGATPATRWCWRSAWAWPPSSAWACRSGSSPSPPTPP